MQYQRRRRSLAIDLESDLRVDSLQEKIALAFRKDLELRLARRLDKQAIPFARHGQNKCRSQLVTAGITVVKLRVDRDFFVHLRRLRESPLRIEQVHPDIVHPYTGRRV